MAMYGNMDTGEITPNNFATRPGIIAGSGPAPANDHLFGSNMGLPELNNNLQISQSRLRSAMPYPISLGRITAEQAMHISTAIIASTVVLSSGFYLAKKDEEAMTIAYFGGIGSLVAALMASMGGTQ